MIQYGGIDLASPGDSIIDLIEKTMTLSDVCPFLPANWSTDAEDAWSLTSVPHHKNLRLNCLYWPTGASRWAFANFVVDSKTLAQLRVKAFPKDLSGQHRALTLKMGGDESGFEISTSMYMLPAYPVVESDGNSLYVITLVDERYFWWEKFTTIGVTGGTTTWATLISSIASALGITIAADSISADYLKPSEDFSSRYEYLPILLDSVLDSVGHRLVRHTSGTYTTESATTAKTNDDVQLKKWERQSGGLFNFEQGKVADFPGLLPKEVTVVFPRRNDGKYLSTEYVVTTTLASLGLTQFDPGLTGRNTKKLFRSTALAASTGGGSPSNSAELTTLAARIATDYYLWQLGRQHQRYANIVPYSPTGMVDHVEWTLKAERKDTTVRRWQRNVSEQTLYHRGTGGSASKCCGNIYINDSDIYFGGDSSYSFNGNLIIDNDITNITTGNFNFTDVTITYTNSDVTYTNTNITIDNTSTLVINIPVYYENTDDTTTGGDNYNPGTTPIITVTPTTDTTVITGLVPTDVTKDEIRYIINDSTTYNLFLSPNDTSSSSSNRFYRVNDVPYRIPPGQGVIVRYDSDLTNWYLISPPQPTRNNTFTTTIATSTNDLDVKQSEVIIITPSGGDQTLTGLAEVLRGAAFIIENGDATNNLILENASVSSASGNRFDCGSGGDDTITPGGMRTCMYDDTNEVIKVVPTGSGSGEANTGTNLGSGSGVFKDKSGTTLRFRSLVASEGVVSSENTNDISLKLNIGGLTAETIAPEEDYIAFLDATSGTHKKTLGSDFLNGGYNGLEKFNTYLTEYTDWSTASTTNTVTIATYGARTHVDKVLARVKTAFGGGSISALDYTITLESTGESSASDTPAGGLTPAETAHRVSLSEYCGSYTNNTVLKVTVTATGGNLDTLTAGALELWVVHRTLPIPT